MAGISRRNDEKHLHWERAKYYNRIGPTYKSIHFSGAVIYVTASVYPFGDDAGLSADVAKPGMAQVC